MKHFSFRLILLLLAVLGMFFACSIGAVIAQKPAQGAGNESTDKSAPALNIPDFPLQDADEFAPPPPDQLRPSSTQDVSVSPNPILPMRLIDAGGRLIPEMIPLMEDTETNFIASSEILDEDFSSILAEKGYYSGRWLGPGSAMWTINEVKNGASEIGDSISGEYKAGFKKPGEYLISCFIDRDFLFSSAESKENRVTALSSRGIGCFVADATPPDMTIMITEYQTMKRTVFTLKETPPDSPPGSKTWKFSWDGINLNLQSEERKAGSIQGPLPLHNQINLVENKEFPCLVLKKGITYLLNVEATDNYKVENRAWSLVDETGQSIMEANSQRLLLPVDKAFLGIHRFTVRATDKAGNFNEVLIPVRLVPK
ncbi:MAG: hypothetical protein WA705_25405 [Candidatus Ozemobacteraceae bacterium]